jgi:hypothetical protein
MEITYILRISCESSKFDLVDRALNCNRSSNDDVEWEFALINQEEDSDASVDYISIFVPLIENNREKLEEIGISRNDITIWIYYVYEQQCNFEFHPDEMKRLADNGIVLCVSCWQASDKSEEIAPHLKP